MPVANPNGIRYVQTQHTTNTDKLHGQASSVGVYIGTVKDNKDVQNMGRLKVWIQDFGGNPEDQDRWITVSYATPFGGTTSIFEQGSNVAEYADTIKSYGMWMVPPDIDARVLVTFASGRLDLGYWFACIYQTGTTGPVPGLPYGKTHTGADKTRTNKNRKDTNPDIDLKVEHKLHKKLEKQGLDKDKLRGITTSGAERESPSKVFGILTPGQHQFVMDDGDKDGKSRMIRLRTVGGTQLMLDDTIGHVYIISREGKNWIEMSVDGRIHVYAADDISLNSENNINLFAGNSINMQAINEINLQGNATSMVFNSQGLSSYVEGDLRETVTGEASTKVTGNYIEEAAIIHMNGPTPPDALTPYVYNLVVNTGITKAIMPIVPEHEPWKGHSGSINTTAPGTQQLKSDPDPQLVPRDPAPGEHGIPCQGDDPSPSDPSTQPVPVDKAVASNKVKDFIRDQNEYRGYPYEDGPGVSGGYGSPLPIKSANNDQPATTTLASTTTASQGTSSNYETLTGKTVEATAEQQKDAADYKVKKQQELTALQADTQAKLQAIQSEGTAADFPATPRLTADQRLAVLDDARSKGIPSDQALRNANLFGYNLPPTAEMKLQRDIAYNGQNSVPNQNFYNGISVAQSEQLLSQDISRSEIAVRQTLTSAGVTQVTPRQFDSLVSMHNEVGDVSYAYTGGEKISLTNLYGTGQWDRAAGFIAADDRNSPRRQAEANIMINGDYGRPRSASQVVNDGLMRTNYLYQRGTLNEQTTTTSTGQRQAAANSWLMGTGQQMPALNFAERLLTQNNTQLGSGLLGHVKWGY